MTREELVHYTSNIGGKFSLELTNLQDTTKYYEEIISNIEVDKIALDETYFNNFYDKLMKCCQELSGIQSSIIHYTNEIDDFIVEYKDSNFISD